MADELERRRADLLAHLVAVAVAPGGRLVIGVYNEEIDALRTGPSLEDEVAGMGFAVAGRTERPHRRDARLVYRALWLDADAQRQ